jgi:hypothetical protein
MSKIKKSRKASRWVKRPHTCEVLHPILTMETANKPLASIDDLMDAEFGKIGTRQREAFRKEAYDYCVKSNLERKQKKIRNRIQQQNKTVYIMNDLQEKAKVGFYCNRPTEYGLTMPKRDLYCSTDMLIRLATEKPAPLKNFPWRVLKMSMRFLWTVYLSKTGTILRMSISTRRNPIRTETQSWIWRH